MLVVAPSALETTTCARPPLEPSAELKVQLSVTLPEPARLVSLRLNFACKPEGRTPLTAAWSPCSGTSLRFCNVTWATLLEPSGTSTAKPGTDAAIPTSTKESCILPALTPGAAAQTW